VWRWLAANRAWLVNIYLFANILGVTLWQAIDPWRSGYFGVADGIFVAQNLVLAGVVLMRRDHRAIDTRVGHQLIAVAAFFSGAFMVGQPPSEGAALQAVSLIVSVAANLLGIATLLNLGRSFGILIACREIRTGGLYAIIRHPMYLSDILLRTGFVLGHRTPVALALMLLSVGLYIWRAILEERFLLGQPGYPEYMRKVRYRLLPGVF
jgi:protein-S-isoprenylcysteine O-methyltransferase Ste14